MSSYASAGYPFTAYSRKGAYRWKRSWTPSLMRELNRYQASFEKAKDLEEFCPGYRRANAGAKRNCWVRLVTGISSYESANKERVLGDGGRAAGLLQIWSKNCKSLGLGREALRKASNNLRCGVRLMARRVSADRHIAKEYYKQGRYKKRKVRLGLGHMGWTTMRNPFKWRGRTYGHRLYIKKGMNSYKNPKAGSLALRYTVNEHKYHS